MKSINIDRGKGLLDLYTNGDLRTEIIVTHMIKDQKLNELNFLKDIGVTGNLLYRLFDNCCYTNYRNFYRTIHVLMTGVYSNDIIIGNLSSQKSLPFISASLNLLDYHLNPNSDSIESDLTAKYVSENAEIMLPLIESNIELSLIRFKK